MKIGPLHAEIGMARKAHPQIEIARGTTAEAGAALPGETDALAFAYAGWDSDLIGVGSVGVSVFIRPPQGHFAQRTTQGFFQSDEKVGFDVLAWLHVRLPVDRAAGRSTARAKPLASTAEERFKEVAEAGAAKFEIGFTLGRLGPTTCTAAGSGRSTAAVLPIRTKFVVAAPFLGIAQNFVGLIHLLEFGLPGHLVFGDIGMVESRQFAEGQLDLLRCGGAGDAQLFVVILKFNGHGVWIKSPAARFCHACVHVRSIPGRGLHRREAEWFPR